MSQPVGYMGGMKTNDLNSTPSPTVAPERNGSEPSQVIRCNYREHDLEYWPRPSELELARLAAELARTEKIDPKQLLAEAWELYWESCRTLQADHRKVVAAVAREAELARELQPSKQLPAETVPMPGKYPVTHQQVEALLLPKLKGRTAERAALIREYIFSELAKICLVVQPKLAAVTYWELGPDLRERLRWHLKDKVTGLFEEYRKKVFDAEGYSRFAVSFLEWHRRFIAAKKVAAAHQRWAKADPKVSIRVPLKTNRKKTLGVG